MKKQIKKPHKTPDDLQNHKLMVLWAADCAEHVLPFFEKEYPADDRPRKAIEEGREWARGDLPMKMSVIRGASLAAHAAARQTDNPAARFAARAAGQAVAAVHVPRHALAASVTRAKPLRQRAPQASANGSTAAFPSIFVLSRFFFITLTESKPNRSN